MNAHLTSLNRDLWPELPPAAWEDTYRTLHMWSQIVGKVRLALSPKTNHWWEAPLYVNSVGLTTSPIPYASGVFEVQFNFIQHQLLIQTSHATSKTLALKPRSVADFYREFMAALASLGVEVKIWRMPCEIPDPIPFDQDTQHASYDAEYVNRFWRILVSCDAILAGRRGHQGSSVLRLCRAGAGRVRTVSGPATRSFLSSPDEGIYPDVRRRAAVGLPARQVARISAEHLRCRRGPGEVGS